MKKLLILFCSLLMLVGCNSKVETSRVSLTGINEISYSELNKLLKENKQFILYIGRPDCGDCQEFEPILKNYLNEHKNEGVYYLNTKTFREASLKKNATKEEKNAYENMRKKLKFNWTPTLEVITNGKIGNQYKYLDEDYYEMTDREKQIQRRKEFVQEFKDFMSRYYKENN